MRVDREPPMAGRTRRIPPPPEPFVIVREAGAGRHRLLSVFPGLDRVPPFGEYPCAPRERERLARSVWVQVVPGRGEWMYVAPHRVPPDADAHWKPMTNRADCIAVGRSHLRKSPALVLYLDILHELYHVLQRWEGRSLWDGGYSYVDRPTEVEAYRFAVREAYRLGASDAFLRNYLRVMWISRKEHLRLLANVGVPAA